MKDLAHFTLLWVQIQEIWTSLVHLAWLKLPICFIIGAFAFLIGFEHGDAVLTLLILIFFDLGMGVAAAYKNGEVIKSRKILKTATKFGSYMVLFSAAFMTENIVLGVTLIDEAMITFLCLTELVSVMENAGKMGFNVPQKLLGNLRVMRDAR